MKITNWRRKLAATLVAGGMISPAAAHAANLDTNLVINGGFESVDLGTTGYYNAPNVLNWTGPGFAYSHNPGVTGVPDYAGGDVDPPGAGDWYFSTNNNANAASGDFRNPGEFFQDISVGTGASGTQIANGAAVRLSAYMSSYLDDNDFGNVHVEFRDGGGASLGFAQVSDTDPGPDNVWSLTSGVAVVPAGTATLRVSLYGTPINAGTDGYIDNVDVQLTNVANELMILEVNTTTGQAVMKNQTGAAINIDYYEITSAGSSLQPATWTSLQDQDLAGFPAGNGTGNGWEEAGGSSASALGESYLTGNSAVSHSGSVGLGALFNTASLKDLQFSYSVVAPEPLDADFDADGDADGADFLRWQRGLGTASGATKAQGDADGDADVDAADLAIWRGEFGGSGASGPGALVTGFVRYVGGAAAAVPEPSSIVLVGIGLALATLRPRDD